MYQNEQNLNGGLCVKVILEKKKSPRPYITPINEDSLWAENTLAVKAAVINNFQFHLAFGICKTCSNNEVFSL